LGKSDISHKSSISETEKSPMKVDHNRSMNMYSSIKVEPKEDKPNEKFYQKFKRLNKGERNRRGFKKVPKVSPKD